MPSKSEDQENSPDLSIVQVLISNDEGILVAESVLSRSASSQTAFYVYRNEERIFFRGILQINQFDLI